MASVIMAIKGNAKRISDADEIAIEPQIEKMSGLALRPLLQSLMQLPDRLPGLSRKMRLARVLQLPDRIVDVRLEEALERLFVRSLRRHRN